LREEVGEPWDQVVKTQEPRLGGRGRGKGARGGEEAEMLKLGSLVE